MKKYPNFTADEWNAKKVMRSSRTELLKYRLTYLRESAVNWCPGLGTVLANDEVKDGFSERGGYYPVEQKENDAMEHADNSICRPPFKRIGHALTGREPLKEMQRNWIGKSVPGALVKFRIPIAIGMDFRFRNSNKSEIENPKIRSNRSFHHSGRYHFRHYIFWYLRRSTSWLGPLTPPRSKGIDIEAYIAQAKKKSELERMADTKTVSGRFTGSYAINPVNDEKIPIWIADYVLAGYGTGAVMAVPSGDQRDYLFASTMAYL